jgi:hypothetical protein
MRPVFEVANARAMDDCVYVISMIASVIRCTVALNGTTSHDSA